MNLPRPTALGWKAVVFYLVLLGAFFAAPYANLLFLMLAFLTVLGLTHVLWTARNLAGVDAALEDIAPVPAGTGGLVTARLEVPGRTRWAAMLDVQLDRRSRASTPVPRLDDGALVSLRLPSLPRGIHDVAAVRLRSSWPLGLLAARRPVQAPDRLVVYPAPADLTDARGGSGELLDPTAPRAASGDLRQPSALREYRVGDELRQIHWKASARRRSLVVKEWDGARGQGFEILLDRRAPPADLERLLSLVSALALAARERKECLTLHTQGLATTFGTGQRPWDELLEFLAAAEGLPADGIPPPPAPADVVRLAVRPGAVR